MPEFSQCKLDETIFRNVSKIVKTSVFFFFFQTMLDREGENAEPNKGTQKVNFLLRYKQGITDEQYCFELALLA